MRDAKHILAFEQVTIEAEGLYDSAIWDVSFKLRAGELMLIRLEPQQVHLPLADGAEGMMAPRHGRVRFMDRDWSELSADRAAAMRGRIGRAFEDGGWVRNLSMDENITLAQRHHTRRAADDITEEAANLSLAFGLPGLPVGRIAGIRTQDLHRAACVRALLGQPELLLLERPTEQVYPEILPALINMMHAARRRGAAVVWTTTNPEVWANPAIRATHRARMFGARMQVTDEVQ